MSGRQKLRMCGWVERVRILSGRQRSKQLQNVLKNIQLKETLTHTSWNTQYFWNISTLFIFKFCAMFKTCFHPLNWLPPQKINVFSKRLFTGIKSHYFSFKESEAHFRLFTPIIVSCHYDFTVQKWNHNGKKVLLESEWKVFDFDMTEGHFHFSC